MKNIVTAAALSAALCLSTGAMAVDVANEEVSMAQIMALLKSQQHEIEVLKRQLAATNKKVESSEEQIVATVDAVESVAAASEGYAKIANWAEKTHIGGYGELHYNNKKNGKRDEVDNHRFVLFVDHDFSEDVRFVSELELEHSISGDGQVGEVEVEQAYVAWDYAASHSAKIGQFLIPVGIINETHEPDTFYGVERNAVEKNILPATWWEAGVLFNGEIAPGLRYDLAVNSGLNTPTSGSNAFKIRDGRQKVGQAAAEALAYTARLKYTAVPGLELATTVQYQEDIAQGLAMDEASATLLEGHAIYQFDAFTLRALYAMWDLDGDEAEAVGRDEQTGWYVEPSYRFNDRFGVFARYSEWDNNAGSKATDTEVEQVDIGLNYWIVENVVLKVDWADQSNGDGDSFNLGLGFSF